MPSAMNHHPLNAKEVIKGHGTVRDGPNQAALERGARTQDGKHHLPPPPSSPGHHHQQQQLQQQQQQQHHPSSIHSSSAASSSVRRSYPSTNTNAAGKGSSHPTTAPPSSSSSSSSPSSFLSATTTTSSSTPSSPRGITPGVSKSASSSLPPPSSSLTPASAASLTTTATATTTTTPSRGRVEGSRESGTGSPSSGTRNNKAEDSPSSEVETAKVKTVVPASPPTPRGTLSVTQQAQPLSPSRLSKIRQNHLATRKREQMKARTMKLPELAENSELETPSHSPLSSHSQSAHLDTPPTAKVMPQISVSNEDVESPPSPTEDPVTPSLPEAFLRKLGLSTKKITNGFHDGNEDNDDVSVDQLPEKEIESKFLSLSLAFKTDKTTLDQRVSVQERARDLAEQNVDSELQGLREAVEALNELVSDAQVQDIIQKIKQHIDVLEQAAARVSSRAEVYGAVQQERRMYKAMEVMVLYTENLRRLREKEESEVQEARKILSERSGNGYSLDADSSPGRRSMSVCGFNAGGRPMRRRSEIALPRVLGGTGSPSLNPTSSLEHASPLVERTKPANHFLNSSQESEDGEDPKSRFQSAVASTSMQHAVTNTIRRVSLEKQRSGSLTSNSSLSPTTAPSTPFSLKPSTPTLSVTQEVDGKSTGEGTSENTEPARKVSQEEDAFRKGFEEGLKAKLSQELNELRDQQNSISQNLEHVMDKVDQSQSDEEELLESPSRLKIAVAYLERAKDYVIEFDYQANRAFLQKMLALFLVLCAFAVMFMSPPRSIDVKHLAKPPQ